MKEIVWSATGWRAGVKPGRGDKRGHGFILAESRVRTVSHLFFSWKKTVEKELVRVEMPRRRVRA